MTDYASEKRRRIAQFANALQPMHRRTTEIVKDCCFLQIDEKNVDAATVPGLEAVKRREKVRTTTTSDSFEPFYDSDQDIEGWSDEGWREDNHSNRFVQFVFLERHFEMDLPRPMLWPSEAMHLLKRRTGFFFLGDRQMSPSLASVVKRYHPLRKAYVHGDHVSAAEDIAYIFFELWRFPIDSRLYLSTFGGSYTWENGSALD